MGDVTWFTLYSFKVTSLSRAADLPEVLRAAQGHHRDGWVNVKCQRAGVAVSTVSSARGSLQTW